MLLSIPDSLTCGKINGFGTDPKPRDTQNDILKKYLEDGSKMNKVTWNHCSQEK